MAKNAPPPPSTTKEYFTPIWQWLSKPVMKTWLAEAWSGLALLSVLLLMFWFCALSLMLLRLLLLFAFVTAINQNWNMYRTGTYRLTNFCYQRNVYFSFVFKNLARIVKDPGLSVRSKKNPGKPQKEVARPLRPNHPCLDHPFECFFSEKHPKNADLFF